MRAYVNSSFFFFSSRRRHTRSLRDWSSDVCSSDLEQATVVVVPSMGEGFGMVALEAMERGRPVIAADIGGLGELVEHEVTGLLVPPGEAEPLARALERLGVDLELAARMGEAGRWRALERFLQERCTD